MSFIFKFNSSYVSGIDSKAKTAGLYNVKTIWSNLEIIGATKITENSLDFTLLVNTLFQSKKQEENPNNVSLF